MNKIWVNGCFDIVHIGHLHLLQTAAMLGSVRVGIDSDERIKRMKGETRPIFPQFERLLLLKSLKYVDDVCIFDTDEALISLIKAYEPRYMLVGEEYRNKHVIGGEFAKEIIYLPKVGKFSSTDIEARILSQHKDYFKFINELVEYGNEK